MVGRYNRLAELKQEQAMVAEIRQTVTIQSGGILELRSPQFRVGEKAEVIVLLENSAERSPSSVLAAFNALQASLKLTPAAAAQWIQVAQSERHSFGPRE